MEVKSVVYNKVNISYRIMGKGPAVLLIHGFGEDGDVWKFQWALLQQHFRVIVPDMPGSGASELLNLEAVKKEDWIQSYAIVMRAVMQQEAIEKYIVLGHSMGGYIALSMLKKYKDEVVAVGLVHSTARADTEEKIATRLKGIAFIKKYGSAAFLEQSCPNMFGDDFKQNNADRITDQIQAIRNFSPEALVQYYEAMIARHDSIELLKCSKHPFLFIIGEQDKNVLPAESLQQCYLPRIAQVAILTEAAHMGIWEATSKVNDAILQFLNYNMRRCNNRIS